MCRNIRVLHHFAPPTTKDEMRAAALQYVRKVSGTTKPPSVDEAAFARAVDARAHARRRAREGARALEEARGSRLRSDVNVHHVAMRTQKLARLVRFYREVLGLRVVRRTPRSVWLAMGKSILMLERAEKTEPTIPAGTKEFLCFAVRTKG